MHQNQRRSAREPRHAPTVTHEKRLHSARGKGKRKRAEGGDDGKEKCIRDEREHGDVIGQHPALVRRASRPRETTPLPHQKVVMVGGESSEVIEVVVKEEGALAQAPTRRL